MSARDIDDMLETLEKFIVAMIINKITLQSRRLVVFYDFLIVMILQFLHEVLVFLNQSTLSKLILLVLKISDFFLLIKSLFDLLPNR